MQTREYELRSAMVEVGRRMYDRELLVGLEGNLSARIGETEILATPRGVCKGFLREKDLIVTDLEGRLLRGEGQPTTELAMHLVCYRLRPALGAILHGHPPYSTAHALARQPLDRCLMPEVTVTFGVIPVAPYATPSTTEVPESIARLVPDHDAILLANHGLLVVGDDLFSTLYKMETVEHFARIHLLSRGLGEPRAMTGHEYEKLLSIRSIYGLKGSLPRCQTADDPCESERDRLVAEIARRVRATLEGEKP